MKAARPPGQLDVFAAALFTFGTVAVAALQRVTLEDAASSGHVVEVTAGEVFALAAITRLLLGLRPADTACLAGARGILLIGATSWLLLEQHVVFFGFTILAVWLVARCRSQAPLLGLAQLYAAVSFYELWGKVAFKLMAAELVALETVAIARVGRLALPGLTADGPVLRSGSAPWTVVMREGCSSYHNVSLVILVWLSVLTLADARPDRPAFRALAESLAMVVALNIARVLAMVPSRADYLFWHEGGGATLAAAATVLAAALPVAMRLTVRPALAPAPA